MGKVSNVLKMLIILKSRGKMQTRELAEELEVTPRQIARYKDELDKAGIYIKTESGKYGGYLIDTKDYLIGLNVTDNEFWSLIAAQEYLRHEDFIDFNSFKMLVDKICALRQNLNDDTNFIIKRFKENYNFNRERKIWQDFKASAIMHKKIFIKYKSSSQEVNERIVQPYDVFQYKGSLYLVGFCELREKIRQFKLMRIESYKLLEDKFQKNNNFNLKEYLNSSFGIFKDSKKMNIKLKIKYPLAQVIKEKIWVGNQKTKELDNENAILFEAETGGITEIKSWILSMGSAVEVISPNELREKIINEIKNIYKIYK